MLGIFLDTETTGLNPTRHCPIDIAFKIIDLNSGKLKYAYQSLIKPLPTVWDKRDHNSIEVNGFTWEELSHAKDIEVIGKEIVAIFTAQEIQRTNAVFICQNPSFDRGFFNQLVDVYIQELLNWPYHWLDLASMYWSKRLLQSEQNSESIPEKLSFSKNEIAKFYQLPSEASPHRAQAGVDHLIACYKAVTNAKWTVES